MSLLTSAVTVQARAARPIWELVIRSFLHYRSLVIAARRPVQAITALAGFFALFTPGAKAHQLSDSFLILQLTNSQLIGHWDVALKDLLHARGVDPLDQKFMDLRALDPERELKTANVLTRLKIQIDGTAAEIKPVDYSTELYNDGPYAALYFEIPLPNKEPRFLEVQYRLFFDVDTTHRGLLRLQTADKTISGIF